MQSTDTDELVERLRQKYLERKKELPPSENQTSVTNDEAAQKFISSNISKQRSKELDWYNKAIHELFEAVTNDHDHDHELDCSLDGNPDLSGESTAASLLQDSHGLFTDTDVTLPSCLNGSLESPESNGRLRRAGQLCDPFLPSSSALKNVHLEMVDLYEHLKAERQSQQQWEKELQKRERKLKQQMEAFGSLAGLEEMLPARLLAVEEKHQQEVNLLQDLLREKSKENKRLKSSFDTIKELNDNIKKELNEIREQNKKLESQSKRVQARLENLKRKYEHKVSPRGRVKGSQCVKTPKKEKTAASGKSSNKGGSSPTLLKLLALLTDWILDGQTFSSVAGTERKYVTQCLSPEVVLNERCLKVLPLLADQLHHNPMSESDLLVNLLRLIHLALRHMDGNTQHIALPSTLRRIGEAVSKPVRLAAPQCEDPDRPMSYSGAAGGAGRTWALYRSPCPHTRTLSTLILLRTVTQADILAQALDCLLTELISEQSRGLFIQYGGVCVLVSMLRAGRGGQNTPVDILVQLSEQSRYLNPFLDACSCEGFFRTASQLLKNPRLELPLLEKLSILLQKLSSIRKNRRLFELSTLNLQIQELHQQTSHTETFLCLNLRSILNNLK